MESGVINLLLRNMKGFFVLKPNHTHLVLSFVLIEYFNKGVHEEVPYLVHNPITLHLTKGGPLRLPTMGKRIVQ